ncbi:MAG: divalent metal cation transporter [Planctomycetota bacterium]
MSSEKKGMSKIEQDRQLLVDARSKGKLATLGAWIRLSGPGWLQSAITIGGGSLSNSLYLGVLVGFAFLWVQPVAMILGVSMLAAISYVTLSTGERPLKAVNQHVSPILGWSWLLASMAANIVWSMPQYSLSAGALQQNLFPNFFGPGFGGTIAAALVVMAIAIFNVMLYNYGGTGVKIFEIIIKVLIGGIVICFFGVIVKLFMSNQIQWAPVLSGLIPDLTLLFEPSEKLAALIAEVDQDFQEFWETLTISKQRDTLTGAAATAVGINMTFLLPYSMLRKGWNRDFRNLAVFDLATGLVIPFALATGCVVMASASQFHGETEKGLVYGVESKDYVDNAAQKKLSERYWAILDMRLEKQVEISSGEQQSEYEEILTAARTTRDELDNVFDDYQSGDATRAEIDAELEKLNDFYDESIDEADRVFAATIVDRDSFNLAGALAPLLGEGPAKYIFGFGVVAMALNAATMLMLINGLCFCELLGKPAQGRPQIIGSLIPLVAVFALLYWQGAMMWLAVPTSVFCATLLPIAYLAFLLLLNQKKFMGNNMPKPVPRFIWNIFMVLAVLASGALSLFQMNNKLGAPWGYVIFVAFGLLVVVVDLMRKAKRAENAGTA